MGVLLEEGLRYPFRGERSLDLFAIGGLLGISVSIAFQMTVAATSTLFAPLFVAPAVMAVIVLLGYLLRVFDSTLTGDDVPPGFRPLRGLCRDGLELLVLSAAYISVSAAIVLVTLVGLTRAPIDPTSAGFMGTLLFFGASTATLVLALAFGYVYPAGIGRLANGRRLRKAIDPRGQRPVLTHVGYFTAWVFALLLVVPGWAFLLTALSSATAFGVVAAFVTFYAHVVAARLIARGYQTATADLDR
ncbi:DUF4013 domain-containing protein [Natrinema sp. SYSU A 869]|uniref:DUF4013 domain-containing protein n=1 Tax=Natrinema sp. SYSU A 869 TaxID=2871694 RepID=UPI001CA3BFE9|nr:DUF4013 domain-containing protein [Natrinema sp. SYSU A 869]